MFVILDSSAQAWVEAHPPMLTTIYVTRRSGAESDYGLYSSGIVWRKDQIEEAYRTEGN